MSIETGKATQCNWKEDEDGIWDTECGNRFELSADTPSENKMKFCPYCGKSLTEIRFRYDDEENDPTEAMIKERNKG